jgi:hypothetical protein
MGAQHSSGSARRVCCVYACQAMRVCVRVWVRVCVHVCMRVCGKGEGHSGGTVVAGKGHGQARTSPPSNLASSAARSRVHVATDMAEFSSWNRDSSRKQSSCKRHIRAGSVAAHAGSVAAAAAGREQAGREADTGPSAAPVPCTAPAGPSRTHWAGSRHCGISAHVLFTRVCVWDFLEHACTHRDTSACAGARADSSHSDGEPAGGCTPAPAAAALPPDPPLRFRTWSLPWCSWTPAPGTAAAPCADP